MQSIPKMKKWMTWCNPNIRMNANSLSILPERNDVDALLGDTPGYDHSFHTE